MGRLYTLEVLLVLADDFDQVFWVERGLGGRGNRQPLRPDQDEEASKCLLKDDVVGVNRHHFRKTEGLVFLVESHCITSQASTSLVAPLDRS